MADYQTMANDAANKYGVPPALFSALINKESSWNPNAVGTSGEIGLGQIMPSNWASLGIGNPYDPAQNLNGSASLLSTLYGKFGNWFDTLRAYNAGQGAATSSATVSGDYAKSILGAAGMTDTTAPAGSTGAGTGTGKTTVPAFLSDPVGYLTAKLSPYLLIIITILLIAALAWFGFQQVIKE